MPAAAIPVLQTARLTLRAHRRDDHAACAAMWADERVVRHIGGNPFSASESWSKILRYHGLWSLLGFGYWALEERATQAFVGEIGFADFKRDVQSPIEGAPEFGWVLAPQFHGRGYATEAVRAALAWGDATFAGRATTCIIADGNEPSLRVAAKTGFIEIDRTVYAGERVMLLARSASAPHVETAPNARS